MTQDARLPATRRDPALHGNGLRAGPLLGQSLERLTREQASQLTMEIAKARLGLEEKAHHAELDDRHAESATRLHLDGFDAADKGGKLTRHSVSSTIKTGAGTMHVESKSGASCFVATAAYGDEHHVDVVYLRRLRDTRLIRSRNGRLFVAWYYRRGPTIAAVVMRSTILRLSARVAISSLVRLLRSVPAVSEER